ncbi:hypothetical protein L7F22_060755 [Adiantum nelumboides]|nr:hypothetical protein [Adiantum nelumboides]
MGIRCKVSQDWFCKDLLVNNGLFAFSSWVLVLFDCLASWWGHVVVRLQLRFGDGHPNCSGRGARMVASNSILGLWLCYESGILSQLASPCNYHLSEFKKWKVVACFILQLSSKIDLSPTDLLPQCLHTSPMVRPEAWSQLLLLMDGDHLAVLLFSRMQGVRLLLLCQNSGLSSW